MQGMTTDQAIKPVQELTQAAPGIYAENLNSWKINYMKKNLWRTTYVKGDTLDLAKWLSSNLDCICISISIEYPEKPAEL